MFINSRKNQAGVTMIELMVALVIGSIILLGIGTVYSSTKRSNKVQEEFARLQENGRFALNYIARFVREAGYAGCSSGLANMTNTLKQSGSKPFNFSTGIEGYEAAGTGPGEDLTGSPLAEYPDVSSTPGNWTATTAATTVYAEMADGSVDAAIPHSDILIARGVDGSGVEVSDNNQSGQIFFEYTGTEDDACEDGSDKISGVCEGDILVISDCTKSVAFQVSNLQVTGSAPDQEVNATHPDAGDPGNDITSWGGNSATYPDLDFQPGDEMFKVSTKTFYIGKGKNGPALFMQTADGAGQELVEGVENMQVLFGEDTDDPADNIADHYVPADQIAAASNFKNVVAVRITLLLRSVNEIPHRDDADQDIIVGGTTAATGVTLTTPTDKRMRHIMSMTIKLRNRAFSI